PIIGTILENQSLSVKKSNGLYLQLSFLIKLGKRLCVVSAQVLYKVLVSSYRAQASTALEI
ncbi:hypothetical protein WMQ20_26765, partial [Escherichia coli]